jgi:hypothetical protein
MEIFLIKSSYHNEYHVKLWLLYYLFSLLLKILATIWLHDASKKIAEQPNETGAESCNLKTFAVTGYNKGVYVLFSTKK